MTDKKKKDNNIGPEGGKALGGGLKENATLEGLLLGQINWKYIGNENMVGDKGVEALVDALKINVTLKELNLREPALYLKLTVAKAYQIIKLEMMEGELSKKC